MYMFNLGLYNIKDNLNMNHLYNIVLRVLIFITLFDMVFLASEAGNKSDDKIFPIEDVKEYITLKFNDETTGTYNKKQCTNNFEYFLAFDRFELSKKSGITNHVAAIEYPFSKRCFENIHFFLTKEKPYIEFPNIEHFVIMSYLGVSEENNTIIVEAMLENCTSVLGEVLKVVMQITNKYEFEILKEYAKYVTRLYSFSDVAGGGKFKIWSTPDKCEEYEPVNHIEVELGEPEYGILQNITGHYNIILEGCEEVAVTN
ncbi:hypothetical protein SLOPH_468 [Spraguea lophii 42_110]|uniref:Uncharacterized protein n=1 Tax=Spraguea lophii (strain 42_110) TaxID=1358809 RepID=S7W9A5_SPRLO|nr:hypothetical protein SLOPH_468 [Spraguea lophii 42_110]